MKKYISPFPRYRVTLALAACVVLASAHTVIAQDQSTKPDNSAQNKSQDTTAEHQSNAKADRELAATVRKAIVADKDLSVYAHNIKIIVKGGTVTLKGPVKSEDEKQKVKSEATNAAGQNTVVDELTVKE